MSHHNKSVTLHGWLNQSSKFRNECLYYYQRLLDSLAQPTLIQNKIFADLISKGKNTEFGVEHQFHLLKSIKDYQRNVPIRNYENFRPWIERECSQIGGVLTHSPIARWLKTSGTTGHSKKIPYTYHWMSQYRIPAMKAMWGTYLQFCPHLLSHPFAVLDMQTIRDEVTDFVNTIPYQSITNRNPLINEFDWQPPWYEAPWYTPDIPHQYEMKMYYRLRYLIINDVRMIATINPSTLISLKHHFIKQLPQLIRDIYQGELNGMKIFAPDKALAKSLECLLENKQFTFKDIWPNLTMLAFWTTSSAKLYLPQIKALFPNVEILPFMCCGTEGVTAIPIDQQLNHMPLAIDQGLFEFIPATIDLEKIVNGENAYPALLFNELELGQEYHLIMSQLNGLYRYATGDIYRIADFYQQLPRIEFVRRQGAYYSFTGEKLTESQIVMALNIFYEVHKIERGLFMCSPVWSDPPYYKILIEVKKNLMTKNISHLISQSLDYALRDINKEYDAKRDSKRLNCIVVEFIHEGTIDFYLENARKTQNAVQFKYKPFQENTHLFAELLSISKLMCV